jgi:hypothetical protein
VALSQIANSLPGQAEVLSGWYRARSKAIFADGRACCIDELGVKPGMVQCFQDVRLTRKDLFEANLAVTWSVSYANHLPGLVAVIMPPARHPESAPNCGT